MLKQSPKMPVIVGCLALISAVFMPSFVMAEVTGVVITSRATWADSRSFGAAGAFEKLQGRITFAVDPLAKANRRIADLAYAPREASGLVAFSSDFVMLRPIDPAKARAALILEVLNRGHSQANGVFFASPHGAPFKVEDLDKTKLSDAFLFEHGFTMAWLGWQFDLQPGAVRLQAPLSSRGSIVREAFTPDREAASTGVDRLDTPNSYCAADPLQPSASLTVKSRFEGPVETLPRKAWSFARVVDGKPVADRCSIYLPGGFQSDRVYDAVYEGAHPPVAGLGLAAIRDFVSYLKYGGVVSGLADPARPRPRVIGYGYSQSARLLRQYLYQGFTSDEQGRGTFDGLFIASAGAGRGSFNHRYAAPGEAGTSVMSDLRPVDLFPFTDGEETDPITRRQGGLLDEAKRSGTLPKIFYTFSSSEYWARAGSLTYTSVDGRRELPLDPDARLFFFAGTPHAHGPFPPDRGAPEGPGYADLVNFSSSKWGFRALLLDLDEWVGSSRSPPASVYPRLSDGLVAREDVRFPQIPDFAFPGTMPKTWRLDFGPDFEAHGVSTNEPPLMSDPYVLRVPQVDADGNDVGGVALPFLAAPLGTYTGWNHERRDLGGFSYLSGLIGGFKAFPLTKRDRLQSNDPRLSMEERYGDRDGYLAKVRAAATTLVQGRFLLAEDQEKVENESLVVWDGLTGANAPNIVPRK